MNCKELAFALFVIFIIALDDVHGWRTFWKGRRDGGNLLNPAISAKTNLPPDEWFSQKLDHFDNNSAAKWAQRYYTNNTFYKPGGPVFLMIGGEGEATAKWMVQGAWVRYAQEFNALCFQVEHRFYGKSKPTKDLTIENLSFLSSRQALTDLARFIEAMNIEHNLDKNTKWIAFGGSYPGSLAAWLREKFPKLVHGSVSSSGPLLAKADFTEYYDVVKDSLATYSDDCVTAVEKSFDQVEILLRHRIGQLSLNKKFKLCDPVEQSVNNPLDISNLFENLASNFAGVVQYNKDNSPHATITIDQVCDVMINQTIGAQIDRLAAVNDLLLKQQNDSCLDYKYDKMVKEMRNTSWSSDMASGTIQWTYQTCTEFGFYQTSEKKESIFGNRFDLEFFIKQCTDFYGSEFDSKFLSASIRSTNEFYGALHPSTTNVIYVHGSIDPWHALGITESTDPSIPTIYINGTAHCANMYEPKETDPPQLKEARNQIRSFLTNILQ